MVMGKEAFGLSPTFFVIWVNDLGVCMTSHFYLGDACFAWGIP